MRKKELLANCLYKTNAYKAPYYLRALLPDNLKILAYHRICEADELNDQELVSASVDDFDWQVAHVKKFYSPMTFEHVISHLRDNRRLPGNALVITFDDGFADNYLNAYRVLKQHGVSATFFLSTSYIDTDQTFWFNDLSRIIMSNPGKAFELESERIEIENDLASRKTLVERLLQACKSVPDAKRHEYLGSITLQLGGAVSCDSLAKPMSWKMILEMSQNGMEFGSHSITHPILSQLSRQALKTELLDSRRTIEDKIGQKVSVVSYPDGGNDAINGEVLQEARDAGYLFGTSYLHGTNHRVNIGDLMLKRIHVERYVSRAEFASILAFPRLLSYR